MQTLERLTDALMSKKKTVFGKLIVNARLSRTDPLEPDFLPEYDPLYHKPSLGELPRALKHLYLIHAATCMVMWLVPRNRIALWRYKESYMLLCQEVRAHYKFDEADKHSFEICAGFHLHLVAPVENASSEDEPLDNDLLGIIDVVEGRIEKVL